MNEKLRLHFVEKEKEIHSSFQKKIVNNEDGNDGEIAKRL